MNVDITIPVLNEEATLERQVEYVLSYVKRDELRKMNISLILADNGSTDRTAEIGQSLQSKFSSVRYLRLERPGVGLALKSSWRKSSADIIGYMDLDLATDLSHLSHALNPLLFDRIDVVTGSRLLKKSKVIGRSFLREITSRVFNFMLQKYLNVAFTDGMCGFKFLKRKYLEELILLGADSDGWFFSTELLVCAEARGLTLLDLPVTWTDDPNSKAKIGKLTKEYTLAMMRLRRKLSESS